MNKQYTIQTDHNFKKKTINDLPVMFTKEDLDAEPSKPFKITRDGKPELFANWKLTAGRFTKSATELAKKGAVTAIHDIDRFMADMDAYDKRRKQVQ